MALNKEAVGTVGEPYAISWTSKDSLLYAVSLNVSSDQLEYVTENSTGVNQKALPTMPVVWVQGRQVLHQTQCAMLVNSTLQTLCTHRSQSHCISRFLLKEPQLCKASLLHVRQSESCSHRY